MDTGIITDDDRHAALRILEALASKGWVIARYQDCTAAVDNQFAVETIAAIFAEADHA